MQSRLTCLLTVLAVSITAVAATWISVSQAFACALAAVTILSLVAWLGQGRRTAIGYDGVVGPYLLAIVLVLALATCRYLSGIVPMLSSGHQPLFASVAITDSTWFVVFVVAPATVMLLGAYFLARHSPLGVYLAWWTGFYVIADGLLQLTGAVTPSGSQGALFFGSALVALALLVAGCVTCWRLLRPATSTSMPVVKEGLTLRQRNLWTLLFASAVGVYAVALLQQAGPLPLVIIVGSMVGGLFGWRMTTALRPADPAWAVPTFLLMLLFFYVHVGEEALTSFNQSIAALSGKPWNDHDFTLLIGLVGPVTWFFGAWSLWKRQPLGNFLFWFFIVGMILGEPTHLLLFPVLAMNKFDIGYQYFSGMYTALFPMIPAIIALVTIVGERRKVAMPGAAAARVSTNDKRVIGQT